MLKNIDKNEFRIIASIIYIIELSIIDLQIKLLR